MGYDADRVLSLRSAMQRAHGELDGIRSSDPEALDAMRTVRRVQRQLSERWMPLVESLVACKALASYTPTSAGLGDLTQSRLIVMEHVYGWLVVTDPMTPLKQAVTPDQAQALGWLLSHGDVRSLVSDDELVWLDAILGVIARQSHLIQAFLANMTHDGWTHLCNRLGDDRISLMAQQTVVGQLPSVEQVRLTNIDRIFASLGAVLNGGQQRISYSDNDLATLLTAMNPYGAAMIVQHLRLNATDLAAICTRLITRYRQGGLADVQRAGPGTADILMQTMINTPGGSTVFVSGAGSNPALLFDAAHSSDLALRLILDGTDPTQMTIDQAGTVVPQLVRYIRDEYNRGVGFYGQLDGEIALFAVDLVAPWLLQFTRTDAADWALEGDEGVQLLASVMHDDASFARLAARRESIAVGLAARAANSPDSARHAVQDLAAILGLIDTLARQRTITGAAELQHLWDMGFALIDSATSLMSGGLVSRVGSGLAVISMKAMLDQHGITPRDPRGVAHDSLYVLDWQTAVAAAMVVGISFDQMVRDGSIAANTQLPPVPNRRSKNPGAQYSADFSAWLDAAALGPQGVILDGLKQTIASAHEGERNATDLAGG